MWATKLNCGCKIPETCLKFFFRGKETPKATVAGDKVVLMWELWINVNAEIKCINKMTCQDYRKESIITLFMFTGMCYLIPLKFVFCLCFRIIITFSRVVHLYNL